MTAVGLELTRVSVIDEDENVILDELVKPKNPIVDYHTQYSGITATHLEDVKTSLSDIQNKLQSLLCQNTILIGHSLENDLRALKVFQLIHLVHSIS